LGIPRYLLFREQELHLETGFNNLVSLNYFTEKRTIKGRISLVNKTYGIGIRNGSYLYVGFRVIAE
jgi:hypothetical protein